MRHPIIALAVALGIVAAPLTFSPLLSLQAPQPALAQAHAQIDAPITAHTSLHPRPFYHRHRRGIAWFWWVLGIVLVVAIIGGIFWGRRGGGGGGGGGFFFFGGGCGGCGG